MSYFYLKNEEGKLIITRHGTPKINVPKVTIGISSAIVSSIGLLMWGY